MSENLDWLRRERAEAVLLGVPVEVWDRTLAGRQLALLEALDDLSETIRADARRTRLGRYLLRRYRL